MKIYYFKSKEGKLNFGDDLNEWLWDRLLPGVFDGDDDVVFVGIGTILNGNIPKAKKTIVFGSGFGYSSRIPAIDESWYIYCVRGEKTAEMLGLDSSIGVTDSAALLACIDLPECQKRHQFSFMPHVSTVNEEWISLCREMGVHFIDPNNDTHFVIKEILSTEILLAEAMHGAIVADTLRVPWIPIKSNPEVLDFKWHDWCGSVGLKYKPNNILPLWGAKTHPNFFDKVKLKIKREILKKQFNYLMRSRCVCLSEDEIFKAKRDMLLLKLEEFKKDVANGVFSTSKKAGGVID